MADKRDVLIGYVQYLYEFPDSPRRASADAILNELHQNGWAVVPKTMVKTMGDALTELAGDYGCTLREPADVSLPPSGDPCREKRPDESDTWCYACVASQALEETRR